MTKINQIQKGLRELEGGIFQKLCDTYLYKIGYERINPIGSVIGTNKVRKGTPDSLVTLQNGKYIFTEYTTTTEPDRVYAKLKGDLDKCFDETKTGVPVERIEEIVFCHTYTLDAAKENALAEECRKHGVNLNIFGIGPLSYGLYQKYPGLARDFLGIEVDTGQVVAPDEFVSAYNKNKLATPLDTKFQFREKEVAHALRGLEEGNVTIVSGRAGIGKSRLALEACYQFAATHVEYETRCIFNRGPDLFEDLRVHFSEPGHHLIFVDDANRVNRFEYVLQLLHDQDTERCFKIIVTVRDYALDKVREAARPYGGGTEVDLQPLEDNQIKKLVNDEYGINNQHYLDRISDIAQGNPRLAIMVALIAKRYKTLYSISDVTALYDEYYSSIRKDIEDFSDEDILKTAGIVSFLRVVDRLNEEMMNAIQEAFGISQDVFWKAAQRLHDVEALDMYEDEVVRISDQVLATYLFYLAFLKEGALDFSALLIHFFPHLLDRFVAAINPVLNVFDSKFVTDVMRPHVDKVWRIYEKSGEEDNLLRLMDVFWFLKETDTLLHIRDRIAGIDPEPIDPSEWNFESSSHVPSPSLLSVLSMFRHSDERTLGMSLEMLFDFLIKRPVELTHVLHILTDSFGFKHTSNIYGFTVELSVIDALWKRTRAGEDELFSKLFLAVAELFLHTHFDTTESKGRRAFTIIKFELPPSPKLFDLRQTIWRRVLLLYSVFSLQDEVFTLIHKYSKRDYTITVKDIMSRDADEILRFVESELDPGSYRHCLLAQDYLKLLKEFDIAFDKELFHRFIHPIYTLSLLLLDDRKEIFNLDRKIEDYHELKKERIGQHFHDYRFTDYKHFFEQCFEIKELLDQRFTESQLQDGFMDVLLVLSDRNPDLYVKVLEHYLDLGDPLKINSYFLAKKLVEACGAEYAQKILSRHDYPSKRRWLLSFYQILPFKEITAGHLDNLYKLYYKAKFEDLPNDIDFLIKYKKLDRRVIARVTDIILAKAEVDQNYAYVLSQLFKSYTKVNKDIIGSFSEDLDLLKRAYFSVYETVQYTDRKGNEFTRILDLDPYFIFEFIDRMCMRGKFLSRHDDTRNYSFIWRRDDYQELMSRFYEHIYKKGREQSIFIHNFFATYLAPRKSSKENDTIRERQDWFLRELIERKYNDPEIMLLVFNLITQFSLDRCRTYVTLFIKCNKNFLAFERLPLEPTSWSMYWSAVPVYQRRADYFESLLSLFNTVDFLQHKQYIERKIQLLRKQIEEEKKRDFIKD